MTLRLVVFGGDGLVALPALATLSARHQVLAVIRPSDRGPGSWRGAARRLRRWAATWRDPVAAFARARRIPCWNADARDATLPSRLTELAPDLICIAGYPWLLPPDVFALPPLGAINVHPSLLPRHRGPAPQLWIYHANDRETGVTVHQVAKGADTGGILAQEAFPMERGIPVVALRRICAERGAALLARTVDALAAGVSTSQPQDETRATAAPRVRPGTTLVDHASWDVERVWHFLAGLCPFWQEPLRDERDRPVHYRAVIGFERGGSDRPPGVVVRGRAGLVLCAQGGRIRLA